VELSRDAQEAAAAWVLRVVIAFLTMPAAGERYERVLLERFVAPAFAGTRRLTWRCTDLPSGARLAAMTTPGLRSGKAVWLGLWHGQGGQVGAEMAFPVRASQQAPARCICCDARAVLEPAFGQTRLNFLGAAPAGPAPYGRLIV